MIVAVSVGAEDPEEAACRLGRMLEAAMDVAAQAGADGRWGDPEHCGDGFRVTPTDALETFLIDEGGKPKAGALIYVVGRTREVGDDNVPEGWA
jgi:hypothetical protein